MNFSSLLCFRWFCHFDDDNYVNVPRLLKLLDNYNPREDWYLGRPSIPTPLEIFRQGADSSKRSVSRLNRLFAPPSTHTRTHPRSEETRGVWFRFKLLNCSGDVHFCLSLLRVWNWTREDIFMWYRFPRDRPVKRGVYIYTFFQFPLHRYCN